MEQILTELAFETHGEGFTDITSKLNDWIYENNIKKGILVVSIKHTSCSLTINENADPRVLKDLSSYMKALVPEEGSKPVNGDGKSFTYLHSDEGIDDMPAHIKGALTDTSFSVPITNKQMVLGTWQGIFVFEHRFRPHLREVILHLSGMVDNKCD